MVELFTSQAPNAQEKAQELETFTKKFDAAMEDDITAGQLFQDRRAQQVMSIGDDSGSDHSEGLISIYESIH